jgi:hypothetical protein
MWFHETACAGNVQGIQDSTSPCKPPLLFPIRWVRSRPYSPPIDATGHEAVHGSVGDLRGGERRGLPV